MKEVIVRILEMEVKRLKNVGFGKINVVGNARKAELGMKADILGVYGQNGSGKTAIVETLDFLKSLISGEVLTNNIKDYIMKGKTNSECVITFLIQHLEQTFICNYLFKLELLEDNRVIVANEKITFKNCKENKKISLDYDVENDENIFSPKYRYEELIARDKENKIELAVAKKMAKNECRSFFFSEEFMKLADKNHIKDLSNILNALKSYSIKNLFVIKSAHISEIVIGSLVVSLKQPSVFKMEKYNLLKHIIEEINIVIDALIPGMSLYIKEYGVQTIEDGNEGMRFELLSKRGENLIPIQYESEGIKKILSVLNLLIGVYNNENMCVVIDELDSGVYEYLLGEILEVLEEKGKGQLIFTSHNLRPLEMVNKMSLIFTTTNPENRYIRLTNIKNKNNLRDVYLRSINLGGQSEKIYEPTNSFQISRAIKMAGRTLDEN